MNIYIVYHSQTGLTHGLARAISEGAKEKSGAHIFLRSIPDYAGENKIVEKVLGEFPIATAESDNADLIKEYRSIQPYSLDEIKNADALVVGSPVYYGNISAATKLFLESLTPLWVDGSLENKPCGAFVSSGTYHGGKEQTLQSIITCLLTYSMMPVGLPFRSAYMHAHGSLFGPTATRTLTKEDESLAHLYGQRIADIAFAMQYGLSADKEKNN